MPGVLELHQTFGSLSTGEVTAALCVLHLEGELAGIPIDLFPRLSGNCSVIAVLPQSNLNAVVDLMQASDRVAAVMVEEDFDPYQLSTIATRILTDDVFGLEKVMAPGTLIHSQVVGDFREKSACLALLSAFVEQSGMPRKYQDPIAQCVDEMLMNGLYDAPVGADGQHVFSGVPTKTRMRLRTEQSVLVQYASDGKRFAVSVRDAFGSLHRHTVLKHLSKGLYAENQVDRKAGGAGLGLFLMVNSSTAVQFNVLPGVSTEALCMFDLGARKGTLAQFGFITQIDPAGQVATGPARRRRAVPVKPIVWALTVMIPAMLVVLGILAWPRIFGDKTAQVTFTTIPKGATIELEGLTVGTATDGTLFVGDLEIGRSYPVVARLEGYDTKEAVMKTSPGPNALTLELQAAATVALTSLPPGAGVEIEGKPMGTTPLTLTSLAPGATVSLAFKQDGYRTVTARLEVPGRGEVKRVLERLVPSNDFVRVRIVSNPAGAAISQPGKPPTADRTYTPADVFVEAGKVQSFMLTMPKHVPLVIEPFTPARGSQGLEKGGDLVEGTKLRIEASVPGNVTVLGAPHCTDVSLPFDCTLTPGSYVVEYVGPNIKVVRTVIVGDTDTIEKLEIPQRK